MSQIIAIIGKPNVGKSSLFNRLTKTRKAIVDKKSGVTRDRNYEQVEWNGKSFYIIDTGGYIQQNEDSFQKHINKQIEIAIRECNKIIFMVDVKTGITKEDIQINKILRDSNKNIFLTVNKVDNNKLLVDANEFYSFGISKYYAISSINGSGTGDLLDDLVKDMDVENDNQSKDNLHIPKVAIVGKPNVGKSSILNALIDEDRNIVSDIPGTTRDSLDTFYNKFNKKIILIDTAGLRKRNKKFENVEFYSNIRSIKSIEKSDVCIIVIDCLEGIQKQDLNIINLSLRRLKGVIIVINKWDLEKNKTSKTIDTYEKNIKEKLGNNHFVPIIFSSALNKQRIFDIMEKSIEVFNNKNKKINTKQLNEVLVPELKKIHQSNKGRSIKIKFCKQLPRRNPQFIIFANTKNISQNYKRFVNNKIRELFGFEGVPINIYFKTD